MNTKKVTLVLLALVGALFLSSCTGGAAGRGSSWPGVAVDGETAYLTEGAQVFAVRLSDGAQLWKFPAKPDSKISFYATPAIVGDGRLVIGSAGTDHCLYVIDGGSIDQAAQAPAATCAFNGARDRWVAAPLVLDNVAYTPNNDGYLYAVDLASNKLLWSQKITSSGQLWSTPSTDGQVLYISSLDHHVYAVDIASQHLLWGSEVDIDGSAIGSPAVAQDGATLYVGSFNKTVFALDAATGRAAWEKPVVTEDWVWGSPAIGAETIYVGDLAGNLYALDAANGAVIWSVKPDGPITGSPLLVGDQIVVTTESGTVYSYNSEGTVVWQSAIEEKAKIYTSPVLAGDIILVAPLASSADNLLTAFGPGGKIIWNFKPQ